MSITLILVLGVDAEIGDRRRRQAAHPEERLDLAVLERVDALGHAEALAAHVLVGVEAGGLDHAQGVDLGGAAGRAGGDALALHVLDLGDAGAVHRHHVHVVGVHDHQRPDRQLAAGELVRAVDGIPGGVHLAEGDVGLARADQLQVGHRAAGDLRGGGDAGKLLAQDVAEAAAQRIVDAARAAGGDRHLLALGLGRRRPDGGGHGCAAVATASSVLNLIGSCLPRILRFWDATAHGCPHEGATSLACLTDGARLRQAERMAGQTRFSRAARGLVQVSGVSESGPAQTGAIP